MAQINLLKQKSVNRNYGQTLLSLLVKILTIGLVCLVVYYAWLFIQDRSTSGKIVKLQAEMKQKQAEAQGISEKEELFTRQVQLQELDKLINSHKYWSKLMPELARVTLKSASYTSLKADESGIVSLAVTVPNLEELDKFLQVFDNPQFNKNFSDVKIGAFHKVQNKDSTMISFEVKMTFNGDLLKY